MTLEFEMQHEILRLEKYLKVIDTELEKYNKKVSELVEIKKKTEHDLKILKGTIDEDYIRRVEEESLAKILGRRIKV